MSWHFHISRTVKNESIVAPTMLGSNIGINGNIICKPLISWRESQAFTGAKTGY